MKKIISLAAAIATALSIITTAQAAETESKETVIIAGHECWIEDGYYFTDVEGEKCQVINLDDYVPTNKNEQNGAVTYGSIGGFQYDIDLSDGHTYEGRINITNGDDETLVFYRKGCAGQNSFEISTRFLASTSYSVTVWYNYFDSGNSLNGWQDEPEMTLSFNIFVQTHKFFVGTLSQKDCLCKIVFHKEGSSTTETNFRYWIKKATM